MVKKYVIASWSEPDKVSKSVIIGADGTCVRVLPMKDVTMKQIKPGHFRQQSPKDQLTVILACIDGHLSNAESGLLSPDELRDKITPRLLDITLLGQWLKDTWEEK